MATVSNSYIPQAVNAWNAYLDGEQMIGVATSLTNPTMTMKTVEITGGGILGTVAVPLLGQFDSMEQEITFNLFYGSYADAVKVGQMLNLTFRAAMQVMNKAGGYSFVGCRIVETGMLKEMNLGKFEDGATSDASLKIELTYIKVEVDGDEFIEIDKLNGVYKVDGEDMLSEITDLI